ncbi:MAG: hypothetical protein Q4G71_18525 [Pseudomonadota bacterium]|nr:hypothetical protein [Pseudomonadota bacterium]
MSVTLTIKHVPDALADKLRALAARNHRSLQGELMVMLETLGQLHDAGKDARDVQRALAPEPATRAHRPESLADELQALVAGSTLGAEPWLSREEANDRPLRINQPHRPQP